MANGRYLGVDFSGGAAPWKGRVSKPTVWIATVEQERLADLRPVQALEGEGAPFDRLVELLRRGEFAAAGIDAPFALPARHMPAGGHEALLKAVDAMAAADDRPFPRGATLLEFAREIVELERAKPVRETEQAWRSRGVNVRSTLWNGARGGAPFAAACLTLLARAGRPCWPWAFGDGMLVEAFPAGQLRAWGLPFAKYSGAEDRDAREAIVAGVESRIMVSPVMRQTMLECADALDAVLASFGARAAVNGRLADDLPGGWRLEGAIAVEKATG